MRSTTRVGRRVLLAGLVLAPAALVIGRVATPAVSAVAEPVRLMRAPGGGLQPQAVTDPDGGVHLVYFQGAPVAGDLFYAYRAPADTKFGQPIRVNSRPGSAVAMGTIRGGQLAIGRGRRVHVVWNGSAQSIPEPPDPAAGSSRGAPLLYARLNEARTAFEPQRNLMRHTFALDGGGTVAADASGNVYAAWHAAPRAGADEGDRRLWVARSTDDGQTFSPEAAAYEGRTGACACCGSKAFADSRGRVYVLYRAAKGGVERDMILLASGDKGEAFAGTSVQPWKVDT